MEQEIDYLKQTSLALLRAYYARLMNYKSYPIDEEIKEPLWRFRQDFLERSDIAGKLQERVKLNRALLPNDDLTLILELTYESSVFSRGIGSEDVKKILSFSHLPFCDKKRLLIIAKQCEPESEKLTELALFATSLLITLFLRDANKRYRELALDLLQNGECSRTVFIEDRDALKIEIIIQTDLVRAPFIDFSYADFTGLDSIALDFSGQFLKSLKARGITFKSGSGCHFRYACLNEVYLERSILARCDLTGVSLVNGRVMYANMKNTQWKDATLFNANMSSSELNKAYFEESDVSLVNFENANLNGAIFTDCFGLSIPVFINARTLKNNILLSGDFIYSEKEILESKGIICNTKKTHLENFNHLVAKSVSQEAHLYDGPSPLWPKSERFRHDYYWHSDNYQARLCDLNKNEGLYILLDYLVHLTSDTFSYESKFGEFARAKAAISSGRFSEHVVQEFRKRPSHEGRLGSTQIHAMQVNYEPAVWHRYQIKRREVQKKLQENNNFKPLENIFWHRGNRTDNFPVLNESLGEIWAFHGTNPKIAPLITKNGFTTKYATKSNILGIFDVGFGALGKGVYCSDAFGKAANYVDCPVCKNNHCQCSENHRKKFIGDKKSMKCMFVARVLLGNVYIDTEKNRRSEEKLPEGYDSGWGPYIKFYEKSESKSNEFMVDNEDQIYPEFCIFYTEENSDIPETDPVVKTYIPALSIWRSDFSEEWQSLKKAHEDYYRALSKPLRQKALLNLQKNLSDSIQVLPKQIHISEKRQWLSFFEKGIKQEVKLLIELSEEEKSAKSLPKIWWIFNYYEYNAWSQVLNICQILFRKRYSDTIVIQLLLCEAVANYHLGHRQNMLECLNVAWDKNSETVRSYLSLPKNKYLKKAYYFNGLSELQRKDLMKVDGSHHRDKYYSRIAEWSVQRINTTNVSVSQWQVEFWKLGKEPKVVFQKTLDSFRVDEKNTQLSNKIDRFRTEELELELLITKLESLYKPGRLDPIIDGLIQVYFDFSLPLRCGENKLEVSLEEYRKILFNTLKNLSEKCNILISPEMFYNLADVLLVIGDCCRRNQLFEEALQCYDLILRINKQNIKVDQKIKEIMPAKSAPGVLMGKILAQVLRGDLQVFRHSSIPVQEKILSWVDDFKEIKHNGNAFDFEDEIIKTITENDKYQSIVLRNMQALNYVKLNELLKNKNIKTLNIARCSNVGGNLKHLVEKQKNLEMLDISGTKFTQSCQDKLGVFRGEILHLPILNKINLSDCVFPIEDVHQLLFNHEGLSEIYLCNNRDIKSITINSKGVQVGGPWGDICIKSKNLEKLVLDGCQNLHTVLVQCGSFKDLSVSQCSQLKKVVINSRQFEEQTLKDYRAIENNFKH